MRNTIFLLIALFLIAAFLAYLTFRGGGQEEEEGLTRLRVGEVDVLVELAETPSAWTQGLSGRERLGEDEGMLFIFPNSARRRFWMYKMRFALDMLFIDQGRVVEIREDVPAPVGEQDGTEIVVESSASAQWVLEVNSGWMERQGVGVGDSVELQQ